MPSSLPNVRVYLSPETFAVLDAAAKSLGQSKSRLVADLVDAAVPVYQALTDAAVVLQKAPQMQRDALAKSAEEMAEFTASAEEMRSQVLRLLDLGEHGEEPPTSNTGVRK